MGVEDPLIRGRGSTVFRGIDERAIILLRDGSVPLHPPGFSDAVHPLGYYVSVVAALGADDPTLRLEALVVLVKVRSPTDVAAQWECVQTLRRERLDRTGVKLVGLLAAEFTEGRVIGVLGAADVASCDDKARIREICWAAGVAGHMGYRTAIAPLAALAQGASSVSVQLAAAAALGKLRTQDR